MKGVHFAEATGLLLAPDGMENCSDLPVWRDDDHILSCWQLSWRERIKLLLTGKLWFWAFGCATHPPIAMTVDYPFEPSSWERVT
jgi:hypothetical protein